MLRALLMLLCWVSLASARAQELRVERMAETLAPAQLSEAACEGWQAAAWIRHQLDAPAGGWDGRPLAVLISGGVVDQIRLGLAERVYCGQMGDGRRMDSRFHTGVGGVFVPRAGSLEPVEIAISGATYARWLPVISVGTPTAVQQADSKRFVFRVAVLAITFGMSLSTLLAYFVTRERALLHFAISTLLMVVWIALLTGVSGFPEAWLPVGELRTRLLLTLPMLVSAGTLFLMLGAGGLRKRREVQVLGTLLAMLLIGIGLLALVLSPGGLATLGGIAEPTVMLFFLAMIPLSAVLALRGSVSALGNLLALLPLTVMGVLSLFEQGWFAPLKVEGYVAAAAWIAVSASAMLMLRLGSLRKQRDQMRLLAATDPLTGLANRRAALQRLESELQRAHADGGSFGLVFVDIDHFKQINDRFGHAAGDRVLCAIGVLLKQMVRSTDQVARMGGEEFLLILHGADADTSRRLAERIRERIEILPLAGGSPDAPLVCTASIGVLCSAQHAGVSSAELLRRVDQALYRAKNSGRNRVAAAD
jgi:diguanylate cyclase (GGDEF)-like protein